MKVTETDVCQGVRRVATIMPELEAVGLGQGDLAR
jgi:hypothetical protein